MKTIDTEFLIIGGGPAGLGAALRLEEKGREWHLVEAEHQFGGLSSSFVDGKGFTWDCGGHVHFSHYDTFDRYMDLALGPDGWFSHERESWVWVKDRFVPYPFQNNLHRLDPADRERCIEGLRAVSAIRNPQSAIRNFREWILQTFGEGVAELFMIPYNWKVWGYPPETMDYRWIGERVAVPKLAEVLCSVETGKDSVSWGPNNKFRFPKFGGTGSIWVSLGARLPGPRITLGARATRVDARAQTVTAGGKVCHYSHLISTMPLDRLVAITRGPVNRDKAAALVFSGVHVVGVGLDGPTPEHLRTKCWMYFPEPSSPYYRVTLFSHYSPNNCPEPDTQWSLMAEVAESPVKPVDRKRIAEDVVNALVRDGLIPDRGKVCSVATRFLPYAYPTPFLGRDAVVDPILASLEHLDIYSRGRFGAWKYEVGNQDHSFAQGYECVERIVSHGGPEMEPTLNQPDVVNSRRNP